MTLVKPGRWSNGGDCYEASLHFILEFPRPNPKWDGYPREGCVLVHGRPTLQRPPVVKYGHAWIEVPALDLALNVATGCEAVVAIPLYYHFGQINPEECYRYTREQARSMCLRFETYGPWEGPEAP